MSYLETLHPAGPMAASGREALFRERPIETLRRVGLGLAWRLTPERRAGVPALVALHARHLLAPSRELPDPERTLRRVPNVAGVARDLSVSTLVAAYTKGLYPLAHVLQPKWLSPPERCILFYRDYNISKRFRPTIRNSKLRITFDRAFDRVMKNCAAPRDGRRHLTWITPKMMRAYAELHDAGYAHSFEAWNAAGELVGGGYGVSVGRSFQLESMFCFENNSSKIAFAVLNWHLAHWGFPFTDNKSPADYKLKLGFKMVPRGAFLALHREAVQGATKRGRWEVEADLATVAAWRPDGDRG